MAEIVNNDKKHEQIWTVIANQLYKDRKYFIKKDGKEFLKYISVISHRDTIETSLMHNCRPTNIPDEIVDEAFRMWSWTGRHPYDNKSTRALKNLANTVYQGPVRDISVKTGLHSYLYQLYYNAVDLLSERNEDNRIG